LRQRQLLILALRALKDLEHKANLEAEQLGLHRQVSIEVSPANVLGIELNPYAAELARVTVWIGEIQWMLKNGYPIRKNPILQPLDHIENRDALLLLPSPAGGRGAGGEGSSTAHPLPNPLPQVGEGTNAKGNLFDEAQWPAVDAIIGNPPFLGGSKMRAELGDDYTEALRKCYADAYRAVRTWSPTGSKKPAPKLKRASVSVPDLLPRNQFAKVQTKKF